MNIDKKKFFGDTGVLITQGLFLEIGYNVDHAIYTLKEYDWEYDGVVYPSIKRLYLAHEDPEEYDFATTYFASWSHWKRLCANKAVKKFVDEWREELELKLRSQAIRQIIDMTADEKGFQAAKYIAEKGWEKGAVGRPKKDTRERDAKQQSRLDDEFSADIKRLSEEWNMNGSI